MQIALLGTKDAEESLEIRSALLRVGMEVLDFAWDTKDLPQAEGYILFADTENLSPTWLKKLKIQSAKGKPILSIGELGATFLAENGFIPGLLNNWTGLHVQKDSHKEERAVYLCLSIDYQYNAFTGCLNARTLLPLQLATRAQFIIPPGLLLELQAQGLTVFLYCDAKGEPLPQNNLAAISNKAGNVMAMLPYPKLPTSADGLVKSLKHYLESGHIEQVEPLYYWPRR